VERLTLVRVGEVPPGLLRRLESFLGGATGLPCSTASQGVDPRGAYDSQRGQYDCRRLLPLLEAVAGESRVLGMADVDLFSPLFTFVFGEAHLGGRAGIFSIHRLRPALYGLPEDADLLEARARREALHETGHLLGLKHCRRLDCVMQFSGAAEEIDLKPDQFCSPCRALVDGAAV
jgi:archaemetzincin